MKWSPLIIDSATKNRIIRGDMIYGAGESDFSAIVFADTFVELDEDTEFDDRDHRQRLKEFNKQKDRHGIGFAEVELRYIIPFRNA